jgi:protease-4
MSDYEPGSDRPQNNREWQLIENVLLSAHQENRRRRRWSVFFRFLGMAYLFLLLILFLPMTGDVAPAVSGKHTALVEVNGVIAEQKDANADRIVTGLRKAFEAEDSEAVLLRINSPGGSPVQAGQIYREIERLREKHSGKKLYAAITDMGASGGYYVAAAADRIYADPASIVGSIGVIMSGFGFTDAMDELGVERRLLTAGENKAMLDPFQPVDPEQKQHVQTMLTQIHDQFIEAVKKGRGDRLKDPEANKLFSGLFWTGAEATDLGLADGLKSPGQVARDVVGAEDIVNYTPRPNPLDELMKRFGARIGAGLADALGVEDTKLR